MNALERLPAEPAWVGWAAWYLFLGGAAAGLYAWRAVAAVFGRDGDRRAYPVASALALACAAVRTGASGWADRRDAAALAAFAGLAALSTLAGGRGVRARAVAAAGAVAALAFVASTGRLASAGWVAPAWSAPALLASAATTGAASAVLLAAAARRGAAGDAGAGRPAAGHARLHALANVGELAVLAALSASVRAPAGLAFMRMPGMLIPLFVVPVGLVLPLVLAESRGPRGETDAALLTLLGGFAFCVAVAGSPDPPLARS